MLKQICTTLGLKQYSDLTLAVALLKLTLTGWKCKRVLLRSNWIYASGSTFRDFRGLYISFLLPDWTSWASKGWPCGCSLKSILMVKFTFPTSSLKYAMSVVALPGGMLGARSRLKFLPLSLVGKIMIIIIMTLTNVHIRLKRY